jgi:hypothetical protein
MAEQKKKGVLAWRTFTPQRGATTLDYETPPAEGRFALGP